MRLCACVHILYVLAFCLGICVFSCIHRVHPSLSETTYYLHNHPTKRKRHAQFRFTHPYMSEWWIAPLFKVIGVKWTWSLFSLTSHTSCCSSTNTAYLNLPPRKSNFVTVNSNQKHMDSLPKRYLYWNADINKYWQWFFSQSLNKKSIHVSPQDVTVLPGCPCKYVFFSSWKNKILISMAVMSSP